MPVDFKCSSCQCRFSLGGYHYHDFSSGYAGQTLAVCRSCGTPHGLEWALHDRGPAFYPLLRVTVTAISNEARSPMALWLRKDRSISLSDALNLVRGVPFIAIDEAHRHQADAVAKELEALGAIVAVEQVGEEPNPVHGPIQDDRLRFVPTGPSTEEHPSRELWPGSISREASEIACAKCHEIGTLIRSPEELNGCPACKADTLVETGGWIT
jgi:hypothetical protein